MSNIKIVIAEDQHLFRKGMIALLNSIQGFEVIAEGENGEDLMEKIRAKDLKPDIYLLDLSMPVMDGIELTEYLKHRNSNANIIIVSAHDDQDIIVHLYEKGANAFIDKNAEPAEIEQAIRDVHQNGFYINKMAQNALQEIATKKEKAKNNYHQLELSRREKDIVRLVCFEKSSSEIASTLSLGKRTVENYRYNIMRKTGSKNMAGFILFALKTGIVDLAELKIKSY